MIIDLYSFWVRGEAGQGSRKAVYCVIIRESENFAKILIQSIFIKIVTLILYFEIS